MPPQAQLDLAYAAFVNDPNYTVRWGENHFRPQSTLGAYILERWDILLCDGGAEESVIAMVSEQMTLA